VFTAMNDFRRDYLLRLPLPLAQLYSRAYNAKDTRGQHDNCFYLFEALVKLTVAPQVAAYLAEVQQGAPRVESLDRALGQLALPSLGQWVAMLRGLSHHFGHLPDTAAHPLGHLWGQLTRSRRDLPAVRALYGRIKNGPDGQPAEQPSCALLQVLDALVQYRNAVFGHGAARFAEFYEREMGPLLFPAVNELLAEGTLDFLGPAGTQLVYLTELRLRDAGRVEVGLRELVNLQGERRAPLDLSGEQAAALAPNRVAVLWPGRPVPLRLDPLLTYRENELAEEVLFLNRDRNSRQVEYLSYTTGRTERDREMAPALAELLSRVTGQPVSEEQLRELRESSLAETPSVEAVAPGPSPAGRVLGDYEVLAEIGRGGMGVVYLARQLSLGRLVALKTLPADLAGDAGALARFRREIRALGRCDHPNIVKVLSSGTLPDGQMFYAMEYVPGCDLEQVWREVSAASRPAGETVAGQSTWAQAVLSASRKRREQTARRAGGPAQGEGAPVRELPLPPLPDRAAGGDAPGDYVRHVAGLMRDAARALQAVHEQGLVHRDIKPANLMLTADGARVVLMDFGLAKGQSLTMSATRQGGLLGTLRYAAPEQLAAGRLEVGPPADVRGLGVTLWELLTQRRLFADAEDERHLAQMVHDEDLPRLRALDPRLDRDLEAIVARSTERRVADRIASAGQLAEYLQLYLDGQPLPIRPPSMAEMAWRWLREHRTLVHALIVTTFMITATVVIAFWVIVAALNRETNQRKLADEQREVAEAKEREVRRLSYALTMKVAWAAQQGLDIERPRDYLIAARDLNRPDEPDLRGFEWYLLDKVSRWNVRSLRSHNGVTRAVFSPDGRRLAVGYQATGGGECEVIVWEVPSGKRVLTCKGGRGRVTALAFSPDGSRLAAGCSNVKFLGPGESTEFGAAPPGVPPAPAADGRSPAQGEILVWDTASGKKLLERSKPGAHLSAVVISRDGRHLAAAFNSYVLKKADKDKKGSKDQQVETGEVALWDTTTSKPPLLVSSPEKHIRCLAIRPDGKRLAASNTREILIWDTVSGRREKGWRDPDNTVHLSFTADGRHLLSVGEGGGATLWDAATGTQGASAGVPILGRVIDLSLPGDGRRFGAVVNPFGSGLGLGGGLGLGALGSGLGGGFGGGMLGVGGGGFFGMAGGSPEVHLYRAADNRLLRSYPLVSPFVAVSADSRYLAARGSQKTVKIWDVTAEEDETGAVTLQPGLPFSDPDTGDLFNPLGEDSSTRLAVSGVALGARATCLAQALGQEIDLFNARAARPSRHLSGHNRPVRVLALSPDETRLASASEDGKVLLWDTSTGKRLWQTTDRGPVPSALVFSPDGHHLALASVDSSVKFLATATGKAAWALPDAGVCVAFHPDGKYLATGGVSSEATVAGQVALRDVRSGASVWTSAGHADAVTSLAFNRDGTWLASGSEDKAVKLWDAGSGKEVRTFPGHDDVVQCVAFSPDSQRLVTVGGSGRLDRLDRATIKLWDTANGQEVMTFSTTGWLASAYFSADGQKLFAVGPGVAKFWGPKTIVSPPPAPPAIGAMHRKLARRVDFAGIDDPKTNLREALDFLAATYQLKFEVDERAFKRENLNDVLKTDIANPNALEPMKNVTVEAILQKVIARVPVPSGATLVVHDDVVEITTKQQVDGWQEFRAWSRLTGR
jgi:WD40 repeat protein/serine/threonine protein kinase